ncbi:MAG: phytoene desaturase family protein [Mycobacteriales bacterium]
MTRELVDAVVIGAGPNGLVAANRLADAGWSVLVLEEQPEPGGAVRSGEVAAPGFISDLYSSFYPLALASPVIAGLGLEEHGLRWRHAPAALAHPLVDGRAVVLSRDLATTAATVEACGPGDGEAWERLAAEWSRLSPALIPALFRPLPPVLPAARLLRLLGPAGALRFARFAVLPVRRFGAEEFTGDAATLLLAGNALHTDLSPESAGSAIYGWLLAMLGQDVGFPTPEGGAGRLTDALVSRLRAKGGRLECGAAVTRVEVRDGRAVAVRVGGDTVAVRRAVLAGVTAPQLFLGLVGEQHLPARLLDDLRRFEWDGATVKIDWALSGPIQWQQPDVRGAGTVHLGGGLDQLSAYAHQLTLRQVPAEPFLVVGQTTTADPTRSPAGTESAWGYTHVPLHPAADAGGELRGDWFDADDRARFVDRLEGRMEAYAPGFRDLVIGRYVQFPGDLESADANLAGGAVAGGTAAMHQQLIFRPTTGLGRPETPIEGLYLASASAHPGGGVHGAAGSNAAIAALRARTTGRLALAATRALVQRPTGPGPITGGRAGRSGPPGPATGGGRAVRAGAGSARSES